MKKLENKMVELKQKLKRLEGREDSFALALRENPESSNSLNLYLS